MKRTLLLLAIIQFVTFPVLAQQIILDHTNRDMGKVMLGNTVEDIIKVSATEIDAPISISTESSAVYISPNSVSATDASKGANVVVSLTPEDIETTEAVITFSSGSAKTEYTITWSPVEEDITPQYPEHTVISTPYEELFDGTNYDGTSQLPIGWLSTGNEPFITAAMKDLAAVAGSYYLITSGSDEARNERAYTPFFDMKAGVTYNMSFYIYLPATYSANTTIYNSLDVTIGTEQDATTHTTIMEIRNEDISSWKQFVVSFTPQADGEYCFSYALNCQEANSGVVAIDMVKIWAEGDVFPPIADFAFRAWYDQFYMDTVATFSGVPIKMTNKSANGETYLWNVTGPNNMTSTEVNPSFLFDVSGDYTISLTATNAGGSNTVEKTICVNNLNEGSDYSLLSANDNSNEQLLSKYTDIPCFSTDKTYDFVSGLNHYYHQFAERFDFSKYQKMTITGINYWLTSYSRQPIVTDNPSRNWPFRLTFYGEKDGTVDTENIFGQLESTVVDVFGSSGIGLENSKMAAISLSGNPVTVQGNFYMAFEFDESMPVESGDPQIDRNYIAIGLVNHANAETSLYCRPTAGPEGFTELGEWCKVDKLDPQLKGLGIIVSLWCSLTADDGTDIDYIIESDGNTTTINPAEIFSLDGKRVSKAMLQKGQIYIVNGKKWIY